MSELHAPVPLETLNTRPTNSRRRRTSDCSVPDVVIHERAEKATAIVLACDVWDVAVTNEQVAELCR
jgi:DNA-directed RNA polymerase specialized sigma54-like protein